MRRCDECRCRSGAGAEISDFHLRYIRLPQQPASCVYEPLGQKQDVEAQLAGCFVHRLLIRGQQIEKQRAYACFVQHARHILVARTTPATSASVREKHDRDRTFRNVERSLQRHTCRFD